MRVDEHACMPLHVSVQRQIAKRVVGKVWDERLRSENEPTDRRLSR